MRSAPPPPPRAFPAFFLSLIMPGLGHCYGGRPFQGAGLFFAHFLFLAVLILSGVGLAYIAAAALLLRLLIAWSASRAARMAGPPKPGRRRAILAFYGSGLILGFFLRWLVFPAVEVVGDSMEPSLRDGDVAFADRFLHRLLPPLPGKVVVLDYPRVPGGRLVKRVAAVGGEEFAWDDRKTAVPPGQVFVLSDNRSRGPDSRFFGPIAVSAVQFRLISVCWSWDRKTGRVRWNRIGLRI